jgi:hypothetical protein
VDVPSGILGSGSKSPVLKAGPKLDPLTGPERFTSRVQNMTRVGTIPGRVRSPESQIAGKVVGLLKWGDFRYGQVGLDSQRPKLT